MDVVKPFEEESDPWDSLKTDIGNELNQVEQALGEIKLLLEQSQVEVNKLAQRNASLTTKLQQIQSNFDSVPRSDIRTIYDGTMETQQRLFVMRGQLEKLQSDQVQLQRYRKSLERVQQAFQGGIPSGFRGGPPRAGVETLENMIQAQESERQRLSRLMHDGPAQALSNFILQTEIAMRLFDMDQGKAREELTSLKAAATNAFQKIRDFIFELRPMMLDDLGLVPTVRRYVEATKEHAKAEVRFTFTGSERRLEPYLEIMIFRAIQELLGNSLRHSNASHIKVHLDMADTSVKIVVDDNGKGFDVSIIDEQGNMGIKLIKERVEMLGGYLQVDSVIEQGSRITIQIPAQIAVP